MRLYNPSLLHSRAGFSIIELMITIAIVTLVSGVTLVRFSSFNSTVLLKNQAYQIALDIRNAQSYSTSVRDGKSGEYREEYGIRFDVDKPTEYVFFQDSDNFVPARFNGDDRIIGGMPLTLDSRFEIDHICVNNRNCTKDDHLNSLDITFRRPNFDAIFHARDSNDAYISDPVTAAYIFIKAVPSDAKIVIVVFNTGQISVE